MTDTQEIVGAGQQVVPSVAPSLITLTHIIYGLHALSIFIALTSFATIVGAFVFSAPSIVAVIINYVKRNDVRGTFLDSHFSWQIRTFWYAAIWGAVAMFLMFTWIGIPLGLAVMGIAGLWIIYRIVRGWLALQDRRSI